MKIEEVDTSLLKENPDNPRKIRKTDMDKLKRSIQEFGIVDPIIVNNHPGRENIIVGGHQRFQAIKALGISKVPVHYVDLTQEREEMLNVALNKISGEWDDDKLSILLKRLMDADADVSLTGFEEPNIDELIKRDQIDSDSLDVAPPISEVCYVQRGDIFILGGVHRLMCGDSTSGQDFEELMNGLQADCCWTDPPYGVSYSGEANGQAREWDVMDNDELRDDGLKEFLTLVYKNVYQHTKSDTALYSCYASINHMIFEEALAAAGYEVKQQLIWNKGHILGRSDYHWSHEPILYCKKAGQKTGWYGDRTHKTMILNSTIEELEKMTKDELISTINHIREESDVLTVKRDAATKYLHSTQKPVELSQGMIKNSTKINSLIVEPHGGSGSTLIGCEASNRKCYAMEINPRYVQVIIERYIKTFNKAVVREKDKKDWNKIKEGEHVSKKH